MGDRRRIRVGLAPAGAAGVVASLIAAVVCIGLLGAQVLNFNAWPDERVQRPADRAALASLPSAPRAHRPGEARRPGSAARSAQASAPQTRREAAPRSVAATPRAARPVSRRRAAPPKRVRVVRPASPSPGGTAPAPPSGPQPTPVPVQVPQAPPPPVPVRTIVTGVAETTRGAGATVGGQVGQVSPSAGEAVTEASDQVAGTVESAADQLP
jgi:hypothetical protein